MAKTVVVEKNGVQKTVPEEYKNDYIIAGWTEASANHTESANGYSYLATGNKN